MQTQSTFEEMAAKWAEFESNHKTFAEKGNKAAARRARSAANDLKKLITPYRKQSVEDSGN